MSVNAVSGRDVIENGWSVMGAPWTDVVQAIGTILIPVIVAILAFVLTRRQSKSDALLELRADSYRTLVPRLNRLMCYMTFIGEWRDMSQVEVVQMKRLLDRDFYCAAPLFSEHVSDSYEDFIGRCFKVGVGWGKDAAIRSSAYQRRRAWQGEGGWNAEWNGYFLIADHDPIPRTTRQEIRGAYDALVAAMVRDLDITRARSRYTTFGVSRTVHGMREAVDGAPSDRAD